MRRKLATRTLQRRLVKVAVAFAMSQIRPLDGRAEAAILAQMSVLVGVTDGDVLAKASRTVEHLIAKAALVLQTLLRMNSMLVSALVVAIAERTIAMLTFVRLLFRVDGPHVCRQAVTFKLAQIALSSAVARGQVYAKMLQPDMLVQLLLILALVVASFVRTAESKVLMRQQRMLLQSKWSAEQLSALIASALADIVLARKVLVEVAAQFEPTDRRSHKAQQQQ